MATTEQTVQPAAGEQANAAAGAKQAPAQTSPALAMVQQIRAQGFEAIEHVAKIAKEHIDEWPVIAHWLHQNRGNDFVQHVTTQMQSPAAPAPAGKATKYPIVLLHGLGAGPDSFAPQIPAAMQAEGDAVFEVTAPPFESPEERAKAIAPQLQNILAKTGAAKLNLIAWSLGGLDARYLISSMGWADRVASLSMIGTPNRGAATADKVMSVLPEAEAALSTLQGLLGRVAGLADHTPQTIDPAITAIDNQLVKALNIARTLHLAPAEDPKAKDNAAPDPNVARANKLAADVAALARQYQAKLPPNVASALNTLARRLGGDAHNSMANDADVIAAISSLTEANAAKFNKANPDAPSVYYQSWAGVADNSGKLDAADMAKLGKLNGNPGEIGKLDDKSLLQISSYLSRSQANGKLNDGAVPVESAEWGNYRGAIPADHNHLTRPESAADQKRTGFDVVAFYKQIADELAKRGM